MANGDLIFELINQADRILDAGCGARGGHWWPRLSIQELVAVDLMEKPESLPTSGRFYAMDIVGFCHLTEFQRYFDLAVADHIFEHVPDPAAMANGFNQVLKAGGLVHVGIPDATFFTDRFYHLVYPEGGGHISQLTLDKMCQIMSEAGFKLVNHEPWADDWRWFKEFFDWRGRRIQYLDQQAINYIAETFLKELTPERGYYYGWEIVFQKYTDVPPLPWRPVQSLKRPSMPFDLSRRFIRKYVPIRLRRFMRRVAGR